MIHRTFFEFKGVLESGMYIPISLLISLISACSNLQCLSEDVVRPYQDKRLERKKNW